MKETAKQQAQQLRALAENQTRLYYEIQIQRERDARERERERSERELAIKDRDQEILRLENQLLRERLERLSLPPASPPPNSSGKDEE
ncbi:MAG: hypothetical protein ACREEM_21270 [Blastocatellia bacterium]